jgi:hypothetical protein
VIGFTVVPALLLLQLAIDLGHERLELDGTCGIGTGALEVLETFPDFANRDFG